MRTTLRRALLAAPLVLASLAPWPARGGELTPKEGYNLVADLMSGDRKVRRAAGDRLIEARDESLVPALVDAVFFTPRQARAEVLEVLATMTGESGRGGYFEWVEYVGSRSDLEPKDRYIEWKLSLLQRIDPDYAKIFYAGAPARIRLEEIVSGGVRLDGIPTLESPPTVAASVARFMRDKELVFGVSLGGEERAYPRRVLSWHEMLNDTVGGQPVTLSYCTLCGSAILYATGTPGGVARTFGTSGLLYRSNKLMFDRQTYTLWSNLTGEPVVGRLAASPLSLEVLPMTLTTWGDWRERHPDTRVMDVPAVSQQVGRRFNFEYRSGAADRARSGVSFPVWLKNDRLERDAEVFTLKLEGGAKAYPVEELLRAGVVNDELGGEALVLIADRGSGAIRAYRRGEQSFTSGGADWVRDATGRRWSVGELGLRLDGEAGGDTPALERLPGHVAYWFGWYAFYPNTEVWGGG